MPKQIVLESIAKDEKKLLTLAMQNTSEKVQKCEWILPPYDLTGIVISPQVIEIPPLMSTTCVLEYTADFRPWNLENFDKISSFMLKNYGVSFENGTKEKIVKDEGENPLLDNMIKEDLEKQLEGVSTDKKGGKKDVKKEVKKEAVKEVKKDKKYLEEEAQRLEKEELERKQAKEEEDVRRIASFDADGELKKFGGIRKSYENPKSEHSKFIIPLRFYSEGSSEDLKITTFEVKTTCIENKLVFDKTRIDFGEVSMKNRKTVNLKITNTSDKPTAIKMKGLSVTNCFSLVNELRDLKPNSSFNLIIQFCPMSDLPYFETLTVFTEELTVSCELQGYGVQPHVETNLPDGILFMGNSLANNKLTKEIEIKNISNFPVEYEIVKLESKEQNVGGEQPFVYHPYKKVLPAKGTQKVTVTFIGDHYDFVNYREKVLIYVPNQFKENKLIISCCCWERSVYCRPTFTPKFEFSSKGRNSTSSTEPHFLKEFTLDFGEEMERSIVVGNCKGEDNKLDKAGAYEIFMVIN